MNHPQRKSEHLCNKGRDYLEKQGKEEKLPFSEVPIGADIWASKENPSGSLCGSQGCEFFPFSCPASSPPQLLDMFGSLLERPVIAADAADKYSVLISMFSSALDHARLIYSRHIQAELVLGGWHVLSKIDFTGNWI